LVERLGDERAVARHFVAVSTSAERVRAFGIDTENMFGFWDWVGGRYSVWSAIGLPVAILVGMDRFEAFLAGAHAMDEHFRTAPWERNLPVTLGLVGLWNTNLLGAHTMRCSLTTTRCACCPPTCSSSRWRATANGSPGTARRWSASPVRSSGWAGNNGQHAFYQLMHQGTRLVPADFIVAVESQHELPGTRRRCSPTPSLRPRP